MSAPIRTKRDPLWLELKPRNIWHVSLVRTRSFHSSGSLTTPPGEHTRCARTPAAAPVHLVLHLRWRLWVLIFYTSDDLTVYTFVWRLGTFFRDLPVRRTSTWIPRNSYTMGYPAHPGPTCRRDTYLSLRFSLRRRETLSDFRYSRHHYVVRKQGIDTQDLHCIGMFTNVRTGGKKTKKEEPNEKPFVKIRSRCSNISKTGVGPLTLKCVTRIEKFRKQTYALLLTFKKSLPREIIKEISSFIIVPRKGSINNWSQNLNKVCNCSNIKYII